jgi:hypothetical protein
MPFFSREQPPYFRGRTASKPADVATQSTNALTDQGGNLRRRRQVRLKLRLPKLARFG